MALKYGKDKRREKGTKDTGKVRVSSMRETDVVALLVADIHLSLKPPVARSCEEDWLSVQKYYLKQLKELSEKHGNCPIICAGDVFDKWNSPAELINFAISYLPKMYAIPGQHDLPYHSLDDIRKSAYWTLVEAGVIENLPSHNKEAVPLDEINVRMHGFPWGANICPNDFPHSLAIDVAVVHKYVWSKNTGFPGADEQSKVTSAAFRKPLQGYDWVVTGDNHISFEFDNFSPSNDPESRFRLFNCGGFMRRKIDEKGHRPSIGLLHMDKTVTRHYLDVSQDKFLDDKEAKKLESKQWDTSGFIEELGKLADAAIDFGEAVRRRIGSSDNINEETKKLILQSMEN